MKILRAALAGCAVVLAVPGSASGAVSTGGTPAPIRYVAVSDCAKDPRNAAWCGSWWYRTTGGERHPLPGVGRWEGAVAVSGDGRRLAYVRAKDARLVIRDLGGGTRVSKARAWPSGIELDGTRVTMSYDGSLVAVSCCWAGNTMSPARVYDAGTGALLGKVPDVAVRDDVVSFSGDGDQILARSYDEQPGRLRVHDLDGRRTAEVVPPRLVGENGATAALDAAGRTVAVYATGRRPAIALYDLETREVTATIPVPASGQKVGRDPVEKRLMEVDTDVRLDWTGGSTLRMIRKLGFKRTRVQVYAIDTGTGTVRQERGYAVDGTVHEAVSGL
ncbi:hypothetical protein Nocox_23445 [Nonomuraea coxensis DSM 45129]|uniref:Uncharacterized protein n=1 Tax=Nonomuraea coxensis DSM 45129 TaxID=1122611 RepID=A0ABX8U3H0_9ACTN|nr:hypothetical protein [Nonomuraea coxensis]QYC42292.1 hypothetical protein Nocox_23445 [Nonomuraea coxensis DSM 45129]